MKKKHFSEDAALKIYRVATQKDVEIWQDEFDDNDNEFQRCSKCDGHDACEDFGCAFKAGLGHLVENDDLPF